DELFGGGIEAEALFKFLPYLVMVVDKGDEELSELATAFEGETAQRLISLDELMGCCTTEDDIGEHVIQRKVQYRVETVIDRRIADEYGSLGADITVVHFIRTNNLTEKEEVALTQLTRVFPDLGAKMTDVFFRHVLDCVETESVDIGFTDPVTVNARHKILHVQCRGRLVVAECFHPVEIALPRFRVTIKIPNLSLSPVEVRIPQLGRYRLVVVTPFPKRESCSIIIIIVITFGVTPHVSCMMQNNIEDYPHVAFMRGVYQFGQVVHGTKSGINPGEVNDVVSVVRFRVVLKDRAQPQRSTPQVFDVIQILGNSLQRAATGTFKLLARAKPFLFTPGGAWHAGVVVVKPVDHEKVDKLFPPFPRAIRPIGFSGFGR